ncbi:hypothetical protein AB4039_07355 [Streptomyces sp. M-16]|uniref:hypothetical protein n=1 Tax=Streptomyces sp. M-16 TaxID=3233040 RepID=UPI00225324E2
MRLRTTAAALLTSLALVVPTAGQALATGHDRDHDSLGTLHYRFTDGDDEVRNAQIHPADNDTCYRLTHAQRHPAFAVKNETESTALLFEDGSCGGEPQEVLEPGERAHDLRVRSVLFKPSDEHHGRHEGRGDSEEREDEDRNGGPRHAQQRAGDLMNRVFRPVG